jgi:hypothetical protein
MKHCIKLVAILAVSGVIMLTSCGESKTTSEESTEIKAMDSTSKAVKENVEKLEDQTKKVEESLEKLDKEFDTTN